MWPEVRVGAGSDTNNMFINYDKCNDKWMDGGIIGYTQFAHALKWVIILIIYTHWSIINNFGV